MQSPVPGGVIDCRDINELGKQLKKKLKKANVKAAR